MMDRVSSPFDDVQPIGRRLERVDADQGDGDGQVPTAIPASLAALSDDEKWRRRERTRANAVDKAGREHARAGEKNGQRLDRSWSRRPLKVKELVEMSSQLARKSHGLAMSDKAIAHEAKQHIVAFGGLVDKLNALSGRPTQVIALADATAHRDGALELAQRLALVRTT